MKKLLIGILGLFAAIGVWGQPSVLVANKLVVGGTLTNLLVGQYVIEEMSFNNTNAATGVTIKMYDWGAAATNVARAAYSYYTNISATVTNTGTNSAGLTFTNTYPVLISTNVPVAAVTNEQTRLREYYVSAATDSELSNLPQLARGLVLLSDGSGFVTIRYRSVR